MVKDECLWTPADGYTGSVTITATGELPRPYLVTVTARQRKGPGGQWAGTDTARTMKEAHAAAASLKAEVRVWISEQRRRRPA